MNMVAWTGFTVRIFLVQPVVDSMHANQYKINVDVLIYSDHGGQSYYFCIHFYAFH